MNEKLRAAAQAALAIMKKNADRIDFDKEIADLEAALAEPAQEPMHPEMKKMYEDYFDKCFRESSAQQRPWVGLTDEEITQGNRESLVDDWAWESAIRWAQKKLKEKNT